METRVLTVSALYNNNGKGVPFIRLSGKWLEKLGFTIGSKVLVSENQEEITITLQKEDRQATRGL